MSEEIFIKEKATKAKPKKQLSQKQLEGLAKGRAKMAEKRAMKKAMSDAKQRLKKDKAENKIIQQTKETHKTERQQKKKAVKYSEEQEQTYKQKKEMGERSSNKFNKIRMEALKFIKTEDDLEEYDRIMAGVSSAMAKDPAQLYDYLNGHSARLQPAKKAKKKSNLSLIVEEANVQ